ncbi:MAG: hypothetical protein KKH41_04585 [Candidatus Thermoplasmatota archaeon]|nr:hypothetical protein [Euryarchaeota archaeon]MBU4144040.1 hypothetical protein [Candidatus Thermoplasmatota archaeon]MBU4591846.1 hypothetical protein [Candidatus Thermoplasmatota archaeon]
MTKLIPAKCPSCAANLEFPEGMEMGHCMHCGAKVIIDREVHVHGQVAIPCPECNGKGQFDCEQEIRKSKEKLDLLGAVKDHKDINPHCKDAIFNIGVRTVSMNAFFLRPTGCGGDGMCKVIMFSCTKAMKTDGQVSKSDMFSLDGATILKDDSCNRGKCRWCKGTGKLGLIVKEKCEFCDGTGVCHFCKGNAVCTVCGGTGKIKCKACNGTGFKIYKG